MQAVAVLTMEILGQGAGQVAQAGTGVSVSKGAGTQQATNEKAAFPNLLAQGKQKKANSQTSDESCDTGSSSSEQILDGVNLSSVLLQFLTPGDLTTVISEGNTPADSMTVDGMETTLFSTADAVQGMAQMQNGQMVQQPLSDLTEAIQPDAGQGAARAQNGQTAQPSFSDMTAVTQSNVGQETTQPQNGQTVLQSVSNMAAVVQSDAGQREDAFALSENQPGIIKVSGKEPGTKETEQTGQQKLAVDVTKAVTQTLQAMREESAGDAGVGNAVHTFTPLGEKETQKSDGTQTDELSAAVLMGGDTGSKTVEVNNVVQAVEKAISRFTDDLQEAKTTGSEIKIVLEPESLGTLTISVAHTGNGITAKIRTEDKAVCAMISSELSSLVRTIESKGISVDQMDVYYGNGGQSSSFAQNNSFNGQNGRSPVYMVKAAEGTAASLGTPAPDYWRNITAGEILDGTVEYRV